MKGEEAIPSRLTWRIILSLGNLLAALGLSAIGLRQAEAFFRANPPHDNVLPYASVAELACYCWNAPALVLSNLSGEIPAWREFWPGSWPGVFWGRNVSTSFLLFVFLFWWWIGWRLDVRSRPTQRSRIIMVLTNSAGLLFSFYLIYSSAYLLLRRMWEFRWAGGPAIPLSILVWGGGLLVYFLAVFLRMRPSSATGQPLRAGNH